MNVATGSNGSEEASLSQGGGPGESTINAKMTNGTGRLQRLSRIEEPSAVQVRQFLWDEIGLKDLYRGDGYTYDDAGRRGNREFLARQMRISEIEGAVVVDVVPSRG